MAYEPKEWVCGDTITADDLNHIENGIADVGGGGNENYKVLELRQDDSGLNVYDGDTKLTFIDLSSMMRDEALILHWDSMGYSEQGRTYFTSSSSAAITWAFIEWKPSGASLVFFDINQSNETNVTYKNIEY